MTNILLKEAPVQAKPKYVQAADKIRKLIEKGKLKPESKIPNEPLLSEQFNVSRNTIRDAIAMLINEGLLIRQQGRGTFVCSESKRKKRYAICFLLHKVGNPFNSPFSNDVYKGVKERMTEHPDYRLEIREIDKNSDNFDWVEDICTEQTGGIMLQGRFEKELVYRLSKKKPLILLGKILEGFNGFAVCPDSRKIMKESLEYIYSQGHRKTAYLASNLHHAGYKEKYDEYIKLCNEMKIKPLPLTGEYDEAVHNAINAGATAILASSDTAVTAMNEIKKLGLRIPEDISFMPLDDLGQAQIADPQMTAFDVDNEEIGRKAIDLMIEIIEKKNLSPRRINVSGKIIERESTGKVKQ